MSLLSVEKALELVLALAPVPQPEDVDLSDALGRVLLRDAVSRMTQPPFDAAAMDGYALRRADLPGPLQVVGEAAAGRGWDGALAPGQALRIFTGAPVPAGADLVVMQEDTARTGDQVTVTAPPGHDNIRPRGSDFLQGDVVQAGRRIGPADLGLLAAMNVPRLTVARAPTVDVVVGPQNYHRLPDLLARGVDISIIDTDVEMVQAAANFGFKVYYGDGLRLDVLRHAHLWAWWVHITSGDEVAAHGLQRLAVAHQRDGGLLVLLQRGAGQLGRLPEAAHAGDGRPGGH